jgi:hypothetical protein
MNQLVCAALAATLLAGPAFADAPAPVPPPSAAEPKPETAAKVVEKGQKDSKAAKKPVKKGAPEPKDAPCEPVKPCPIE